MSLYFLYARKSTDVEDKQVLSIEGQIAELRQIAKRDNLAIADTFVEKQSAKMPGRPIFNDMLRRIERGEAQGIICWKIDRLARNPVDGGQIQWLLQRGVIQHIRTHDRSHYPNDNVLMMSVELGMANEYIRQLSANTARGLRQKARQGIYPGLAPFGYINDPITKTVIIHRENAALVRKLFETYATGSVRLEDLASIFERSGVVSRNKHRVHISRVSFMLQNPFYYGHFRYAGEVYEGTHEPAITKELYDKANAVLHKRSRAPEVKSPPAPYCGLLRCGGCGMSITAEQKVKRQKNGNVHRYTYYRCTRKSKLMRCKEPPVRSEPLEAELNSLISQFAMPQEWAAPLNALLDEESRRAAGSVLDTIQELRAKVRGISADIARLIDLHVAQDIDRDEYLKRRRALMAEKKSVEERVARLESTPSAWIEPARQWIRDASTLDETAKSGDLPAKKSSLQKIFGLNFLLKNRRIEFYPTEPYAALRAAREIFPEKGLSFILEPEAGLEPATCGLRYRCSTN
jgi:site-specific DNA recombinase